MLQDIRYTLRMLARKPAWSAVVVLTLALGIGASTAIFSVVKAVLLTPLPYSQPDRLLAVYSQFPSLGFTRFWLSPREVVEYRQYARSFQDLGAYRLDAVNVKTRDEATRANSAKVSADVFTVLRVRPELGQAFTPAQDVPHAEPVALLGDSLWRRAFGGDPGILGRRVLIDGAERTIIGIMPAGFDLEDKHVEVWTPLALGIPKQSDRTSHYLSLVGRLRPGVSVEAARAELEGILGQWPNDLPKMHTPNRKNHRLVMVPLLDDLAGGVRPALRMLAGAVSFLLLIAIANVSNLLLVKAEGRQRETSIRTALGADRGRLVRQFLTESVVLALAAGILGVALAAVGTRALVALNIESIPRGNQIRIDEWSLAAALAVSVFCGLLFGIAPALHARTGAFGALKAGGQRTTVDRKRQALRRGLVIAELALAVTLIIGGGLLMRSFLRLQQVDPGFRVAGTLSFRISLPDSPPGGSPHVIAFYERLSDELAALPGVEAASGMTGALPKRFVDANDMDFEGVPKQPGGVEHNADFWQFVTGNFFKALGVQIIAGRPFLPSDSATAPPVVIINDAMAKRFWPGRNPLGQRLRSPGQAWATIVGVAKDVKQGGLDQESGTEVYFLFRQAPKTVGDVVTTMYFVLRTSTDPTGMAGAVRATVSRLDPSLAIEKMQPMQAAVYESMARPRFITVLVLVFAAIALLLAAVGTYAVLAYAVEQRTQEIGIRMALGAQSGTVLGMVLLQGARVVAAGLSIGLLLSLALGKVFAGLLFGVASTDFITYAAVMLLLSVIALAACYFPARRAAHVDPLTAMGSE